MKLLACNFSPSKALLPSEWQTVVLSTSVALNAPYEWDVNAPVAQLLPGWTPERFQAIRTHQSSSPSLTHRQRLILDFVFEIANRDKVGQGRMKELQDHFTNEEVMEIFIVHGIYATLARTMNSCQIDLDQEIPGLNQMLAKSFAKDIERERESLHNGITRDEVDHSA